MRSTAIPADRVPVPGAGISANLAAVGIGTETDGSIVCPSSSNGLAGIKPTVGLVSRAGIIPISHSQDSCGPDVPHVARCRDSAQCFDRGRSRGFGDRASAGKSQTDYAQFCDPNGLKGARIGVARKYFGFSDAVDALMEEALDVMKRAGRDSGRSGRHRDPGQVRRKRIDWSSCTN